jgi:hypothetical protein
LKARGFFQFLYRLPMAIGTRSFMMPDVAIGHF